MNRKDATQLVAILAAAYPAAQIQEQTAYAYQMGLSDIAYADAERAVSVLMRTSKFMPTVAEIREVLADASTNLEPWDAAWDELASAVDQYGSYLHHPSRGWPGWSDDLVASAVRHIGYENACTMDSSNIGTIRAQFRDYYRNAANRQKKIVQTGDAALPAGNIRALKGGVA